MPDPASAVPSPDGAGTRPPSPASSLLAALAMCLAVLAVYVPAPLLSGDQVLFGMDYDQLHQRRLEFAQSALFGPAHALPAWYPREILGAPFRANLQSFPWIPLRLALLAVDSWKAFAVGIALCSCAAALGAYLLGRALRIGPLPAAVAGWTFACNGDFAARVTVGHLPILETFWILPALLWLAHGALTRTRRWPFLAGLAFTAWCAAVAGHPQLGFYSLLTTAAYLLVSRSRRALVAALAVAGGLACSAFAVLPMLGLILRSTRVLHLESAGNDIPMAYGRLWAFVAPWSDGWPGILQRFPNQPFTGYPTEAYFWDTVVYTGLLPLAAVIVLGAAWRLGKARPDRLAGFLAVCSVVALVTALPHASKLWSLLVPGTLLRSAARQLYVTELGLALALGAALQLLWTARPLFTPAVRRGLVLLLAAVHALDVGAHARAFLVLFPTQTAPRPTLAAALATVSPDERVGIDVNLPSPLNRRLDDVGFFDSLVLAPTYRSVLALSGIRADWNTEVLTGSELSRRALESTSVAVVAGFRPRTDLPFLGADGGLSTYRVPAPVPRALLFPAPNVRTASSSEIDRVLRNPALDLHQTVTLVDAPAPFPAGAEPPATPLPVPFVRPSSDTIELTVDAPWPGVLRVLESRDRGWSAEVDGEDAPLLLADGFAMALPLTAGEHRVRLEYRTPLATAGLWISALAAVLLGLGLWWDARRSRLAAPPIASG